MALEGDADTEVCYSPHLPDVAKLSSKDSVGSCFFTHHPWHVTDLIASLQSAGIRRPGFLQSDRCEIGSHCCLAAYLSPWGEHVLPSWLVFQVFLSMNCTRSRFSCDDSSRDSVSSWSSVFKVHSCWSMGQKADSWTIVCPYSVLPARSSGLFSTVWFSWITVLWALAFFLKKKKSTQASASCLLGVFPEKLYHRPNV